VDYLLQLLSLAITYTLVRSTHILSSCEEGLGKTLSYISQAELSVCSHILLLTLRFNYFEHSKMLADRPWSSGLSIVL
jgi:hypothetical protein